MTLLNIYLKQDCQSSSLNLLFQVHVLQGTYDAACTIAYYSKFYHHPSCWMVASIHI